MRRTEDIDIGKQALRGRDLVVFSNDWDGDPLSKTHIMRILSRDNRVLWVNSIGNRAPKANAHDAARIVKKLRTFTEGVKEVEPNLFVLAPLAIPFYGSEAVKAANRVLLRAQVQRAMKKLGFRRPISWSFLPASAPVSGTLGEELVVYHCVDEFSAFSDTNGKHIAELEQQLLRKADLVITSAERLRENKAKVNPNTVLVRHGVDFNHFVKAADPATVVPEEIAKLPKPVIGFFGLIADWVDMDAIAACAKAYPNGSVVMLGKIAPDADVSKLKALPNVHFLGRKKYEELPGYTQGVRRRADAVRDQRAHPQREPAQGARVPRRGHPGGLLGHPRGPQGRPVQDRRDLRGVPREGGRVPRRGCGPEPRARPEDLPRELGREGRRDPPLRRRGRGEARQVATPQRRRNGDRLHFSAESSEKEFFAKM